jgi:hypothetical protein
VKLINQNHEILRGAVPGGGGEVTDHLIPPGAIEGMLHDGQEFHVGKCHLLHMVDEIGGHLPIGEETVSLSRNSSPGTEMDLINGPGSLQAIRERSVPHPFGIVPLIIQTPDDRTCFGRTFPKKGKGISLVHPEGVILGEEMIFVG